MNVKNIVVRLAEAQSRYGSDSRHPADLQPAMIPIAERWIVHYVRLLHESPRSAVDPLASLLADAVFVASTAEPPRETP